MTATKRQRKVHNEKHHNLYENQGSIISRAHTRSS